MTQKVLLTLSGLQANQTEDDADRIETVSHGDYYMKNGKHYVIFDETVEGINDILKSKLKFDENTVEVSRSGVMSSHMVFQENKKNLTGYNTPFGQILMGIDTKKIHITEQEHRIIVDVDYSLEVNDEFMSDCHMHIDIRSLV